MKYSDVTAVILCAGKGERAKLGFNKILHPLDESTVIERTVAAFSFLPKIIAVINKDDGDEIKQKLSGLDNIVFCEGGETRTQSVRNALLLTGDGIVVIHDGARPFVNRDIIENCIQSARKNGSGIASVKSQNAVRVFSGGSFLPVERNDVRIIQTPQAFDAKKLKAAYNNVSGNFADDSEIYQKDGNEIFLTEGSYQNIKLTNPADFFNLGGNYKIGCGFDVHALTLGRKLILGGIEIEHYKGLLGHSDADVLVHAVMDALLSAEGLPDIGVMFPDTDDSYKDISSIKLLKRVTDKINGKICFVSACVMAQKPKLAGYIDAMRTSLATALNICVDDINISATTTEHLGICGNEQGIASQCYVILRY